eukprot:3583040-Pleurochrysis_carterae.AAC.6
MALQIVLIGRYCKFRDWYASYCKTQYPYRKRSNKCLLAKEALYVLKVPGGGDCQYIAISVSLLLLSMTIVREQPTLHQQLKDLSRLLKDGPKPANKRAMIGVDALRLVVLNESCARMFQKMRANGFHEINTMEERIMLDASDSDKASLARQSIYNDITMCFTDAVASAAQKGEMLFTRRSGSSASTTTTTREAAINAKNAAERDFLLLS